MTSPVQTIWVFNTVFKGELNSRLAIAHAFEGANTIVLEMPKTFGGWSAPEGVPWPDLIVHSFAQPGESDFLLSLQSRASKKITLVHIDDPGPRRSEFDLIVNPTHQPAISAENVIRPLGLPSSVTSQRLTDAEAEWSEAFSTFPRPIVSVFLGGQTTLQTFSVEAAAEFGLKVATLIRKTGGSLLFSTSRRTPEKVAKAFLGQISGIPSFFYDGRAGVGPNPYFGMMAFSDFLIVTADSLSMMSDAATSGLPTYIFAKNSFTEPRHRALVVDLVRSGRAKILANELQPWSYSPLTVSHEIADAVLSQLGCNPLLLRYE